jgi:hypothetical protein
VKKDVESELKINPNIRKMAYIPALVPYIIARTPNSEKTYKIYCFPPEQIPNVGQSVTVIFTKPQFGNDPLPEIYKNQNP